MISDKHTIVLQVRQLNWMNRHAKMFT